MVILLVAISLKSVPVSAASTLSYVSADVSSLQHGEDLGLSILYANGTAGDPLQILKDNGVNYIRLRIWVNPANGYNNETKSLSVCKDCQGERVKATD